MSVSSPTLKEPPTETVFGNLFTKISSITLSPTLTAFIFLPSLTVSVLIPTIKVSVKPTTDVVNPETDIDSWSLSSKNGRQLAWTSFALFHVNTACSNLFKFVVIFDTPIPKISLTSALNPPPLVSVSSKSTASPTLYPVPPFNTCTSWTPPLVTDSISVACLITSFDSMIKSLSASSSPTLCG